MDKLCLHCRFALLTNSAFVGSTHLMVVNRTAKEKFPGTIYTRTCVMLLCLALVSEICTIYTNQVVLPAFVWSCRNKVKCLLLFYRCPLLQQPAKWCALRGDRKNGKQTIPANLELVETLEFNYIYQADFIVYH